MYTIQEVLNSVFDPSSNGLKIAGSVSGDLTVTGDLTVLGDFDFGDVSTDTFTCNGDAEFLATALFKDESAITANLVTMQSGSSATPVTGAYYTDYSTGYFGGTGVSAVKQVSLVSKGLGVLGGRGGYGVLVTTDATDNAAAYTYGFGVQLDDTLGGSAQHLGLSLVGNFNVDIAKSGLYDLKISNSAHDASGNGMDIVFGVAGGTDGNDNAGDYVFSWADASGDGLQPFVRFKKSFVATGADDASSAVVPSLETSAWNTDTTAAVNGSFIMIAEGLDGDNNSGAFGELKFHWLSDDGTLEHGFLSFTDGNVSFDITDAATVGTQEINGNFVNFGTAAWDVDSATSQEVYYSMQGMANAAGAGETTSADLAWFNNAGNEKMRLTDAGTLAPTGGIVPRTGTVASSATITPTSAASDIYTVTALGENAAIAAPSGTPVNGQKLTIRIKDDGTTRTLAWNGIYNVVGVTLPTDTTAGKTHYIGCIYNSANSKWDVLAVGEEV